MSQEVELNGGRHFGTIRGERGGKYRTRLQAANDPHTAHDTINSINHGRAG